LRTDRWKTSDFSFRPGVSIVYQKSVRPRRDGPTGGEKNYLLEKSYSREEALFGGDGRRKKLWRGLFVGGDGIQEGAGGAEIRLLRAHESRRSHHQPRTGRRIFQDICDFVNALAQLQPGHSKQTRSPGHRAIAVAASRRNKASMQFERGGNLDCAVSKLRKSASIDRPLDRGVQSTIGLIAESETAQRTRPSCFRRCTENRGLTV
jgi:hypothetical protein